MKGFKLDNVTFGYQKESPLFEGLSLNIEKATENVGYIFALMGSSGSGKSTFLKLLMGTLNPLVGTIESNPKPPVISYLPQSPVLFEHLSPLSNARYFSSVRGYKKLFDEKQFESLSKSLGMDHILKNSKSIWDLSGGEKQRLMLLRALSIKPDFLLLDEPTTGLDFEVSFQFLKNLREIVQSSNVLAIYVTHSKKETEYIADEVIYLAKEEDMVYHLPLLSIVHSPPTTEIAKVFMPQGSNLIKMSFSQSGKLALPYKGSEQENFSVMINQKNILFQENEGFPFKLLQSNPAYAHIQLVDGQELVIDAIKFHTWNENLRIIFFGDVLKFDSENKLVSKFVLN